MKKYTHLIAIVAGIMLCLWNMTGCQSNQIDTGIFSEDEVIEELKEYEQVIKVRAIESNSNGESIDDRTVTESDGTKDKENLTLSIGLKDSIGGEDELIGVCEKIYGSKAMSEYGSIHLDIYQGEDTVATIIIVSSESDTKTSYFWMLNENRTALQEAYDNSSIFSIIDSVKKLQSTLDNFEEFYGF